MLRNRTSFIIDDLLSAIATLGVGATAIAIASPQVAELLSKPLAKHYQRKERLREYRRLIHYMKRQNLIDIQELSDDKVRITITGKGKKRIRDIDFNTMRIARPLRWDRKWRIVIFDIPEELREARNALRQKLKEQDFQQIQQSVWAHPFPCLEELTIIKNYFEVNQYVTLLEAEEIESHNTLVKKFKHLLDPLL